METLFSDFISVQYTFQVQQNFQEQFTEVSYILEQNTVLRQLHLARRESASDLKIKFSFCKNTA